MIKFILALNIGAILLIFVSCGPETATPNQNTPKNQKKVTEAAKKAGKNNEKNNSRKINRDEGGQLANAGKTIRKAEQTGENDLPGNQGKTNSTTTAQDECKKLSKFFNKIVETNTKAFIQIRTGNKEQLIKFSNDFELIDKQLETFDKSLECEETYNNTNNKITFKYVTKIYNNIKEQTLINLGETSLKMGSKEECSKVPFTFKNPITQQEIKEQCDFVMNLQKDFLCDFKSIAISTRLSRENCERRLK
jgi:hypothetical protein